MMRKIVGVAVAVGVAAFLFRGKLAAALSLPVCPFHAITGLYCPFCGSTRALLALLHGDLAAALRLNALMVVLLPLFVWFFARDAALRRKGSAPRPIHPAIVWSVIGAIVLFGIARNFPWWPFTFLAPH